MYKKNVDIGSIIKKIVKERKITIADFSRQLGFPCRSSVYSIFKKRSIDTELLIDISNILNYPFLLEYFEADEKHVNRPILLNEADSIKIKKIITELSNDKLRIINKLIDNVQNIIQ